MIRTLSQKLCARTKKVSRFARQLAALAKAVAAVMRDEENGFDCFVAELEEHSSSARIRFVRHLLLEGWRDVSFTNAYVPGFP